MGCASQKGHNNSLEHHIGEFGDIFSRIKKAETLKFPLFDFLSI
jgi:hypothetical protein